MIFLTLALMRIRQFFVGMMSIIWTFTAAVFSGGFTSCLYNGTEIEQKYVFAVKKLNLCDKC